MNYRKPFHLSIVMLIASIVFLAVIFVPQKIYCAEAAQTIVVVNPVNLASPLMPPQVILSVEKTKVEEYVLVTPGSNGVVGIVAVSARD